MKLSPGSFLANHASNQEKNPGDSAPLRPSRQATFLVAGIGIAWLACHSEALAVVIRHDRNDSDYLSYGSLLRAVVRIDTPYNFGSGTLIAPNLVLTAAHVLDPVENPQSAHVIFSSGAAYSITSIQRHPLYSPSSTFSLYDVAVITLDCGVSDVAPIPWGRIDLLSDPLLTLAGYGLTGDGLTGQTTSDGKLRAATNRVHSGLSDLALLTVSFSSPELPDVTDLEGSSAPGDSGGPVLTESEDGLQIVAITTAGTGESRIPYGSLTFALRTAVFGSSFIDPVIADTQPPSCYRPAFSVAENCYSLTCFSLALIVLSTCRYRPAKSRRRIG